MFRKWKDIENSYRFDFIEKFVAKYPKLAVNEEYEITEKLDGSNFSITFHKDGHLQFSKRSGIAGDDFYNYKEALKEEKTKDFVSAITSFCVKNLITIQFIGELFGREIQKRINYGNSIFWRWFAIYEFVKEEAFFYTIQEQKEFIKCVFEETDFDIWNLKVPEIGVRNIKDFPSFEEMLDSIDIRQNSIFTPYNVKKNIMEGVVVRPINNYQMGDAWFILKKKNPEFADNEPKKKKTPIEIKKEIRDMIDLGVAYVNKNRTHDLFSKYGRLDNMHLFGDYMKHYIKDVMEDFIKDNGHEFSKLEKKDKHIFSKAIMKEIKEELINSFKNLDKKLKL